MAVISQLSITNAALIKIGQEVLSSVDDPYKSAYLAKARFEHIRDTVLAAHPWNFAMKRASFTLLGSRPAFGHSSEYQIPADCLRIWKPAYEARFVVEDGKVLTDEPSFSASYIARVENPAKFSPAFAEAMSARLAAELAYAITQSSTVQSSMMAMYDALIRDARFEDAQEGTPEDLLQGEWMRARL